MIRKSLQVTKAATFAVLWPIPGQPVAQYPAGTGFFVSPDGWFITAAHVVTENGEATGPVRPDIGKGRVTKEVGKIIKKPEIQQLETYNIESLEVILPDVDFALLKLNVENNAGNLQNHGKATYPHLDITVAIQEEGAPVYSFGYPLGTVANFILGPYLMYSLELSPRTTSAVIASSIEKNWNPLKPSNSDVYILDKPLNYGNSGGPVVSSESGKVFAFCSRFQPMYVPQSHLSPSPGSPLLSIMIPSLYGVVNSLSSKDIINALNQRGIPYSA